jgi:vacuolar-type H+-ATPase subunit E/Vma4
LVNNDSVDRIVNQIREDGEKEIRSILDKARETASEITGKAEIIREETVARMIKEARDKGELAERRLLSSVKIEVKRAKLKSREEIVSRINAMVRGALEETRKDADYPAILADLVMEAVRILRGDSFFVYVDRRDMATLREKVFPEVRKRMAGESRQIAVLEAVELEKASFGGARVGVPDGKVIFDNTFEARLYRMRDEIRNIIFREVFEPEGREGSGSA